MSLKNLFILVKGEAQGDTRLGMGVGEGQEGAARVWGKERAVGLDTSACRAKARCSGLPCTDRKGAVRPPALLRCPDAPGCRECTAGHHPRQLANHHKAHVS